MRRFHLTSILALLVLVAACAPSPATSPAEDPGAAEATTQADEAALQALLDDFLANAGVASAHERFWAEDLVYTSSDGTRTYKPAMMAGMQEPATEPGPTYWAEDVDIRLYGTTAVIAFKLMIGPPEGSEGPVRYNLNTGTFLKRDGMWKAVAWQSTRGAE
jgi:hypothetical protein